MADRPSLGLKDVEPNSYERSVQGQALCHDTVLKGGCQPFGATPWAP